MPLRQTPKIFPAAAYSGTNTGTITEIVFNGGLETSVSQGVDKSYEAPDKSINCLIDYLEKLKNK